MADQDLWRKNIPEDFDGRFGERFDDELAPKEVIKISVGILVTCVVALLVCVGLIRYLESSAEKSFDVAPSPLTLANERQLPAGPLLQASPEAELHAMRAEMSARLNGYGWADESRGLVHIPIEKAIEMVAAGTTLRVPAMDAMEEESSSTEEQEGVSDGTVEETTEEASSE